MAGVSCMLERWDGDEGQAAVRGQITRGFSFDFDCQNQKKEMVVYSSWGSERLLKTTASVLCGEDWMEQETSAVVQGRDNGCWNCNEVLDTQMEMGGGRFSFRDAEREATSVLNPPLTSLKKFNCTKIEIIGILLKICRGRGRASLGEHVGTFDMAPFISL